MGRIKKPEDPLALWTGKDRIGDEILDSVTTIVRSGGCSWNRCRICQYRHERFTNIDAEELKRLMHAQLSTLAEEIERTDPGVVKVYTSGSFFDKKEVPVSIQEEVVSLASGRNLVVESRCEYIDEERVGKYVDILRE